MKAFELRQLSDEELRKRIEEETENLANLKFQKVLSQLENPMKIRHIRRDLARMKTVLGERKRAGAQSTTVQQNTEKTPSQE